MMLRARPGHAACLLVAALGACTVERAPSGRPEGLAAAPPADSAASAEVYAALRLYYTRVTAREWKLLAQSFWPRAAITAIMRPAAGDTERVQTVTIEEALARASAMRECPASLSDEIARANVVTYGPLADAWVTYRARCGVTRDSVTTHYGIDAFHLMKQGAQWRIASLTVTPEIAGEPLGRQP
jgi:hypothetical protein